jgi:transcriptional regulator with XRE-family HTH domain
MAKKPQRRSAQPTVDPLVADMGKRIRRARDDAGMSQEEFAKAINRRQASVSDIENGKMEVTAGTLAKMAIVLKKPISYFFADWIIQRVGQEDLSAEEEELLSFARKLPVSDLRSITIQVRALSERGDRTYHEWLDEEGDRPRFPAT